MKMIFFLYCECFFEWWMLELWVILKFGWIVVEIVCEWNDLFGVQRNYLNVLKIDMLFFVDFLLVKVMVFGVNEILGIQLVISLEDGKEYCSYYFLQWLYIDFWIFEFSYWVIIKLLFCVYCWNGDNGKVLVIWKFFV